MDGIGRMIFLWWCFRIYQEWVSEFIQYTRKCDGEIYLCERAMCMLRWCEPTDGLIQNTHKTDLSCESSWVELAAIFHVMFFHSRLFFCCCHIQQRVGVLSSRLDFVLITSTKLLIEREDFGIFFVLYAYVSHCFPNAICRRLRLTQYFFYTFISWRRIKSRFLSAVKYDGGGRKSFMLSEGKNYAHILCFFQQRLRLCCQRL